MLFCLLRNSSKNRYQKLRWGSDPVQDFVISTPGGVQARLHRAVGSLTLGVATLPTAGLGTRWTSWSFPIQASLWFYAYLWSGATNFWGLAKHQAYALIFSQELKQGQAASPEACRSY